jgi:hypothetical protein
MKYILPEYSNEEHTEKYSDEKIEEYRVGYKKSGMQITLTEKNFLVEDEYGLTLKSAKYLAEGTEIKESMIHHHKKGHPSRHLQFKLQAEKETIRIFLDNLDEEDYSRCIKGFLHISQELIAREQKENNITDNLIEYFFNKNIQTLTNERRFLLGKISESFKQGQITAEDKKIDKNKLSALQQTHIRPFLEF